MSDEWRWTDPQGQQRIVRTDELRAGLVSGAVPPNAPVWRKGWPAWKPALDVPELRSSAAANNGSAPASSSPVGVLPTIGNGDQPPPPPRYVPTGPKRLASGEIPATASTSPAQVAARAARAAVSKRTVMGLAPAPNAPNAPPAGAPASGGTASGSQAPSASDALKRALPDSSSRAPQQAPAPGAATVVGVPAIPDPRKQAEPASLLPALNPVVTPSPPAAAAPKSPSPGPAAPPEPAQKDKSGKRQTLILYGGAPQDGEEKAAEPPTSNVPNAPPIVVPAPGAQPGKNAVTQAPPWGEGAVGIGPEIPKSAPTPRLKQDSVEEISASVLLDSDDEGPVDVQNVGPSPSLKPRSIPPPVPKRFNTGAPKAPAGERAAPTIPPASGLPREAREPMPSATGAQASKDDVFPWMEPVLERFPQLRKLQEGKPKLFLPVMGGLVGFVLLLILAKGCSALFGGGESTTTAATQPSASASSAASAPSSSTHAPASASPSAATSAPPVAAVAPPSACTVVGTPKSIGPHALVPSGVEVLAVPSGIAVGFAAGAKDAVALVVDPSSLDVTSTAKLRAVDTLKRVTPFGSAKSVAIAGDLDRRSDKIAGRRTISDTPPIDVGVADNGLVFAPHGTDKTTQLWPLTGEGAAEALRGVAVQGDASTAYAVAFRRGGAIWLGYIARGKELHANGDLAGTAGLGTVVGSPAIGVSGDQALVVWADRASSDEPWGLRWQRGKLGAAPETARAFAPPPGGLGAPFMSPSVVGLGHGRFLLVWTEGEVASHQVRALTIDEKGDAVGAPLVVSAEGVNAGQGQAAIGADGKGLIAYLAANGKGFEVMATSIACAAP